MSNIIVKTKFSKVNAKGEFTPLVNGSFDNTEKPLRNPAKFIAVIGFLVAATLDAIGQTGKTFYSMQVSTEGATMDYSGTFEANKNPFLTLLSFAKHWFCTKLVEIPILDEAKKPVLIGGIPQTKKVANFVPFGGILKEELLTFATENGNFSLALAALDDYYKTLATTAKMGLAENNAMNGTTERKAIISEARKNAKLLAAPKVETIANSGLIADNAAAEVARQAAVDAEIAQHEATKAAALQGKKQPAKADKATA